MDLALQRIIDGSHRRDLLDVSILVVMDLALQRGVAAAVHSP